MGKVWEGRFDKKTDPLMEQFNASLYFDKKLYAQDIKASIVHAQMLANQSIITKENFLLIKKGLLEIKLAMENNQFVFDAKDEDIHMAIEKELTKRIGKAGAFLHTARSRNDQVNVDVRLYLRKEIDDQCFLIVEILRIFTELSEKNQLVILPGFTHLQLAQPITLAYYFMAYFFMLQRDLNRFIDLRKRVDICPLGSGAFAGVNYQVDRFFVAKELGFQKVSHNAMDAVSDRDFMLEYFSVSSILMMHLSRINEEFILYSNKLFNFIEIDDAFATGSSIMPNKKNPDACELIRGKTGRVYGHLVGLLSTLKALPLAYNKDLQEDKEGLFDVVNQLNNCLSIFPKILESMKINKDKMKEACEKGYLQATDLADYLVKKKLPFREAHEIVGKLVKFLEKEKKIFLDLSLKEYQQFSPLFEDDIYHHLKLETVIKNKISFGSTSFDSVKKQIKTARSILKKYSTFFN